MLLKYSTDNSWGFLPAFPHIRQLLKVGRLCSALRSCYDWESGEWDRGVDEETRKDDKLMERQYKGRAEEKMMLGADGQRAGGKSYWWLLHLRSASESYKHSSAECSTQPYHCSTLTLRVQLHVCPPNRCICNFFLCHWLLYFAFGSYLDSPIL